MRATLLVLVASLLAALGCSGPADAPIAGLAQARMALVPALATADVIEIEVHDADGLVKTETLEPPWLAETLITVDPGPGQRLEFVARVGDIDLARGSSAEFEAPETGTIDVRVVIDLMGVLDVLPLDLPVGAVLGVSATPLDPFEGQPASYALTASDGAFSAALPVGRYRLDFELTAQVLDWIAPASLEVEVVAGVRQRWAESFVPPEAPIPEVIATGLEVIVVGGSLAGGLLREPADVVVRAIDDEGRVAINYRGEVSFDVLELIDVLPLELLPAPHRFTEEDAGVHLFEASLLAPLTLLPGVVRLQISDDAALSTVLAVDVIP